MSTDKETWFVMFYAPWCSTCHKLPHEIAQLSVHPDVTAIMKKKVFSSNERANESLGRASERISRTNERTNKYLLSFFLSFSLPGLYVGPSLRFLHVTIMGVAGKVLHERQDELPRERGAVPRAWDQALPYSSLL